MVVIGSGEQCESVSCLGCGEVIDKTILENRTIERREFWKCRTDMEMKEISREEKVAKENEEALRFGF